MVDLNKLTSPTADLSQILKEAGDRTLANLKKLKPQELKEVPTTGAVAKDVAEAAKAGENANLAPLAKDNIEFGGYESPSPNIKIKGKTPIPEGLLKYLKTDEPIGAVTQDIDTMVLPKHDIIDRPDLRDK